MDNTYSWLALGFFLGFSMNWILPYLYRKFNTRFPKWRSCLNSSYAKYNDGE